MRSYVNKKDERVNVSKDHLDTAVEIKQKLQKASPSNRCSWAQHKQLMKAQGFEDSCTSEAYRVLIKSYQKSIGKLPDSVTYADTVLSDKLESYRDLVGELAWEKRENQNYLREIQKGKREIVDKGVLINEISDAIKESFKSLNLKDVSSYKVSDIDTKQGSTRAVMLATDWHIGAVVDVESNQFNYEIAVERVNDFADKTMKMAKDRGVSKIDLVYMGDIIEHVSMRGGQSFNAEFSLSEQIVMASRLMIKLIVKLSSEFQVSYRGFAGNHDRINGKKDENVERDNAMVVVNESVRQFVELLNSDGIEYHETHPYNAKLLDINGINVKLVHGHNDRKTDNKKLSRHSLNDEIIYNVIIMGHYHHFEVIEVGNDKFEIFVGSIKGSDVYTEDLGLGASPSQAVMFIDSNGDIDVVRVKV